MFAFHRAAAWVGLYGADLEYRHAPLPVFPFNRSLPSASGFPTTRQKQRQMVIQVPDASCPALQAVNAVTPVNTAWNAQLDGSPLEIHLASGVRIVPLGMVLYLVVR